MATERARYFRLDSTAGGDGTEDRTDGATRAYPSLAAAVLAETADLVAADVFLTLITTQPGVDTEYVAIINYTTSATCYIWITALEDARVNGISREKDGLGYQLRGPGNTGRLMKCQEAYVRVRDIEICTTALGIACFSLDDQATDSSDIRLERLLLTTAASGASGLPLLNDHASGGANVTITNMLIICNNQRGIDMRDCDLTIDHLGIISGNNSYGHLVDADCNITNSYSVGAGINDWYTGSPTVLGSNNASLDGSHTSHTWPNSVQIVSLAAEFVNADSLPEECDAHLKEDGTGLLVEAGTGTQTFDIARQTRTPGLIDIGPFSLVDQGGNGTPTVGRKRRSLVNQRGILTLVR